ncbi:unnamed protein product [Rhodiola kirilowii]
MAQEPNGEKPLKDYSTPSLTGFQSPIAPPGVNAPQFELKPALINMVGNNAFTGIGNPNAHLASFLELCATFKFNNVPKENIYLRLFPFSLTGKAKDWLWSHDANTFTTWDELAQAFLLQYFPPAKTQRLKNLINSFEQGEDETFYEAWERFKELQRECPHHNIDKPTLIQIFYQGMDPESKRQMDQAAGGAFMEVHPTNGGAIIDKISRNSHHWGSERSFPKRKSKTREVEEVDSREDVRALSKKIDALTTSLSALHVKQLQKQPRVCAICTSPSHMENQCPHAFPSDEMESKEEVNFLKGNQASYGRDRNQDYQRQGQGYQRQTYQGQASHFQPQQQDQPQQSHMEESPMTKLLATLVAGQNKNTQDQINSTQENKFMFQSINQRLDEITAHNKMLEMQIAQQAESSARAQGKLPSRPEHDKKEYCNTVYIEGSFEDELLEDELWEREEQCEAVTLRCGKKLEGVAPKKTAQMPPKPVGQARAEEREFDEEVPNPPTEKAEESKERKEELKPYVPPLPFPQRQVKTSKLDKEYEVFTKMLKKLYVYIPFHELIKKAPLYNKFLKEILSKKRTIEEDDPQSLNHECSALFSKKIPQKAKDPGKFTIPCSIGDMNFTSPLADLGASVSVMPLATYHELGLKGMKSAKMTLQLADGTTRRPWGLVENVPIKVDKFYIPCDFVVIDMGDNCTSSLILGRPFLATAGFKLDMGKGKLTLKIGGEKVTIEKPMSERVDELEPCGLKEQESVEAEDVEAKKVTKKGLRKMVDSDEGPFLDHYELPSCHDGVKGKVNAKTGRNEKQGSHWSNAIKQVACNSSKNPD